MGYFKRRWEESRTPEQVKDAVEYARWKNAEADYVFRLKRSIELAKKEQKNRPPETPMNHSLKRAPMWRTAQWTCHTCHRAGTWLVHLTPSPRAGEKLHSLESPGCEGPVTITMVSDEEAV